MKLSGRDARRIADRPDPRFAGYLFFGEDQTETIARRERLVAALLGGDDMALTRVDPQAARRDPAMLADALRASGFFGGRPVVVIDGITDGVTEAVASATEGLRSDEGVLVCSAKLLFARSKLRQFFEKAPNLAAAPVYDDPPDEAEIAELLAAAGAPRADDGAMAELMALARGVDGGTFRQTVARLGIHAIGESRLTAALVADCAPPAMDADADGLVDAAAMGDAARVATLCARLEAQGAAPVTVGIAASRRLRQLHRLAVAPGGPEAAGAALRPPLRGPRLQAAMGLLRRWNPPRLEQAMGVMTDLELVLRSSAPAPQWASLERALVRVAMLAR